VITLFGNVQTKLKTYALAEYVPPDGLAPSDLDSAWQELLQSEAKRSRAINAQIRKYARSIVGLRDNLMQSLRIKEDLRKKFADLANAFADRLHEVSVELASIEGPLQVYYSTFCSQWTLTVFLAVGPRTKRKGDPKANTQAIGGPRRCGRSRS
jgi:hypothetical protein